MGHPKASQENKIYRANKFLRDKIRQSLPKSPEKGALRHDGAVEETRSDNTNLR